jgi:hypothetical protein
MSTQKQIRGYPELSEVENAKVARQWVEATHPLTPEEQTKVKEFIAGFKYSVALARVAEVCKISSSRQHQIWQCLHQSDDFQLFYERGKWFAGFRRVKQ